jgi:hypothetical protein
MPLDLSRASTQFRLRAHLHASISWPHSFAFANIVSQTIAFGASRDPLSSDYASSTFNPISYTSYPCS